MCPTIIISPAASSGPPGPPGPAIATFIGYIDATSGLPLGDSGVSGSPAAIPANSEILQAWMDVLTPFTSSSETASIKLRQKTDQDLLATTAITDIPAGAVNLLPDGSAGFTIKTTADGTPIVTVIGEALTGGKAKLFAFLAQSDA